MMNRWSFIDNAFDLKFADGHIFAKMTFGIKSCGTRHDCVIGLPENWKTESATTRITSRKVIPQTIPIVIFKYGRKYYGTLVLVSLYSELSILDNTEYLIAWFSGIAHCSGCYLHKSALPRERPRNRKRFHRRTIEGGAYGITDWSASLLMHYTNRGNDTPVFWQYLLQSWKCHLESRQ